MGAAVKGERVCGEDELVSAIVEEGLLMSRGGSPERLARFWHLAPGRAVDLVGVAPGPVDGGGAGDGRNGAEGPAPVNTQRPAPVAAPRRHPIRGQAGAARLYWHAFYLDPSAPSPASSLPLVTSSRGSTMEVLWGQA